MVRAKFSCHSKVEDGDRANLIFHAVYSGSPENQAFFKYTPAGHITLSTVNKATADQFEQGKQYYVDFTPAEA